MNRTEVQALLRSVASTWPGTPITHEAIDLWLAASGDLSGQEAAAALAHWAATNSHPPRPADLNGAHRALYPVDPEWSKRADIAPSMIQQGPAHEAPEVAHAELAKMRALIDTAKRPPSAVARPTKVTGPLPGLRTPNAEDERASTVPA